MNFTVRSYIVEMDIAGPPDLYWNADALNMLLLLDSTLFMK